MDDTKIEELFPGYPNVITGVKKMVQIWEIGNGKLSSVKATYPCNLSMPKVVMLSGWEQELKIESQK